MPLMSRRKLMFAATGVAAASLYVLEVNAGFAQRHMQNHDAVSQLLLMGQDRSRGEVHIRSMGADGEDGALLIHGRTSGQTNQNQG